MNHKQNNNRLSGCFRMTIDQQKLFILRVPQKNYNNLFLVNVAILQPFIWGIVEQSMFFDIPQFVGRKSLQS